MKRCKRVLLFLLWTALAVPANATVQPNGLFADGMVLQRDKPIMVWGTAASGEKVTVQLSGQSVSTTAQGGKWSVQLSPLKAGGPFEMTIAGQNTLTVKDVLVGEVWVCAGQSNMERTMIPKGPHQSPVLNSAQEVAAANFPQMRQFLVASGGSDQPSARCQGQWIACSPQTAPDFTAVGFFFGRALYQHLNVPVGLIFASQGGTAAEFWTSQDALDKTPELKGIMDQFRQEKADLPAAKEAYQKQLPDLQKQYEADAALAQQQGKPAPKPPHPPGLPHSVPGNLFNGKIAPLIPYAIRGVVWYQGETNSGRGRQYRTLFPALIADWRQHWGEGDFPFLFVQIAPYKGNTAPFPNDPEVREAQLLTSKTTPNTAMAVITDTADGTDLHPPNKKPVGERLALAARALAYGEKIEYSGPVYNAVTFQGNRAMIHFTHTGGGLTARGGPLKGFVIAGPDGKFVPANAAIEKDTVVVSSPQVADPKAVRLGWDQIPQTNLFNAEGLPASPFRTDDR